MNRAALPPLTPEQRAEAAARGVAARQLRAELRIGLRDGSVPVAAVLADGHRDDERGRVLARMRVVDLVSSFRGIGPVRAADLMADLGIAANRRVGGLGPHQVNALVEALERRSSGNVGAHADSSDDVQPG